MKKWLNEKASLEGVRSRAQQANHILAHPWIDPLSREKLPLRSLPLAPDEIEMGFSTDSTGEVRVDLNTYHEHIRAGT